jgi:hypothetical protein
MKGQIMRLTIILGLDNDAFKPHPKDETERILADLAKQIGQQGIYPDKSIILRDVSGNRVGIADVFDN